MTVRIPDTLVSVDAHKRTITYVVFVRGREVERKRRALATPETLSDLAERYPGAEFIFEACGVQEWMLDHLWARGVHANAVTPPKKRRKGNKSDTGDALRMGTLHMAGALDIVYVPRADVRPLRDLVRHHEFLTRKQTSFKNRLRHELNRWNVHPSTPDGKEEPGPYTRAARESVQSVLPLTGDLYDVIWDLTARTKRLYREMEKKTREIPEVARLVTIPGWGPKTALAFHVETGPVSRFQNAKQVVSFYGLEPVRGQSGDAEWDEHHISRKGRDYLRGLLVEAAWTHVRTCRESDASRWFYAATARGKNKMEAIVGVARRLVEVAFAMLRDRRDFTLNWPAPSAPCRPDAAEA